MKYEYLLVLSFFYIVSLYIEWKYKIHLYHSRKERIITTLVLFIIGSVWDNFAVWRGHWVFPGFGIMGPRIFFLPIEEYLFILIVPFWVLTTYKLLTKKIK